MIQIPDRNHNTRKKAVEDCPIPQHVKKLMSDNGLTFPENGKVSIVPDRNDSIIIIIENFDAKGKCKKPIIKEIDKKLNKPVCLEFKDGHCTNC